MDHKPSILQDLELGRPMEIDGMFDAPLVLARIAGVADADARPAGGALQTTSPGLGPLWELTMETRVYGRTGMKISILGFGCGAVGGLMVRGAAADQEKAIGAGAGRRHQLLRHRRAMYGIGASETNLGRVLAKLKPSASSSARKCGCRRRISAASPRR